MTKETNTPLKSIYGSKSLEEYYRLERLNNPKLKEKEKEEE